MANLDSWIGLVIQEGYSPARAAARVCQDIACRQIESFLYELK